MWPPTAPRTPPKCENCRQRRFRDERNRVGAYCAASGESLRPEEDYDDCPYYQPPAEDRRRKARA